RRHHRGDRGAYAEFDQDDAQVLPVFRIRRQYVVVEKIATEQNAEQADPGIEQDAAGDAAAQEAVGNDAFGGVDAVDENEQDEGGSEDHAGLEPAARAHLAVKLHVQREQEDERHQESGDDAENDVVPHSPSSRSRRRQLPSRKSTPIPAEKMTTTSPRVSKPR